MRDNIQITEKVVFLNEVEATKKTIKLPLELVKIDLVTGTAILHCIAFKDQSCKDKYIGKIDKYDSDFSILKSDKTDFLNRKKIWDADVLKGFVKNKDTTPETIEIEKAAFNKKIEDRRKSMLSEQSALNNRTISLKAPVINRAESEYINRPVVISDTSIFDDLANQITI